MNAHRRAAALLGAAALAFAFAIGSSPACPLQAPPQPLRSLYKSSERVVVARVGEREVLKTVEGVASVRVALRVTESVKGPSEPRVLHLHHEEYVGGGVENLNEGARPVSYSGRQPARLVRGERYLFFLEPRAAGGCCEVNDVSYGIKKLSDEDLKVYLGRLKELADITRRESEDRHALLEWLVRCAEEPATRWEGAYELLESAGAAARAEAKVNVKGVAEEVREAPAVAASDAPAGAEAQDEMLSQSPSALGAEVTSESITALPTLGLKAFALFRYTPADPGLAPMLNAVQKQRLADALFASAEPSEGDDLLMQLVRDFEDPRLPAFLLARLHRFEEEPPLEAELWLRLLAGSLGNEQLSRLADSYSEQTTFDEDGEGASAGADEPAGGEAEVSDEPREETPEERQARGALARAAAERATRKRSAALKAVLARLDLFVATGRLAPAER